MKLLTIAVGSSVLGQCLGSVTEGGSSSSRDPGSNDNKNEQINQIQNYNYSSKSKSAAVSDSSDHATQSQTQQNARSDYNHDKFPKSSSSATASESGDTGYRDLERRLARDSMLGTISDEKRNSRYGKDIPSDVATKYANHMLRTVPDNPSDSDSSDSNYSKKKSESNKRKLIESESNNHDASLRQTTTSKTNTVTTESDKFKEKLSKAASKLRKLAYQDYLNEWSWLPSTAFRIYGSSTSKGYASSAYVIAGDMNLQAKTEGWLYDQVYVQLPFSDSFNAAHHTTPRFKWVDGSIQSRVQCQDGGGKDVRMGTVDANGLTSFGESGTYATSQKLLIGDISQSSARIISTPDSGTTSQPFTFMHGGRYQLCYAADGNFGTRTASEVTSNWLSVGLFVQGVQSSCNTPNCLKDERWECWYPGLSEYPGMGGQTIPWVTCDISFKTGDKRSGWNIHHLNGVESKMTWTALFKDEVYGADGVVSTAATNEECVTSVSDSTLWDDDPTPNYMPVINTAQAATMPRFSHELTGAYTVRLCYCPDYQSCDTRSDYIQAFGKLYFWRLNICDYGNGISNNGTDCTSNPYLRVIPHVKFSAQIACPPSGGCYNNNFNRIAFVPNNVLNNRNFWDSNSGCSTMYFNQESPAAYWPSNGQSRSLGGGSRQDYKIWQDNQVRLDIGQGEQIDVCYCNGADSNACSTATNWFRIGHVVGSHFNLAFRGGTTGKPAYGIELNQVAGRQGAINFVGGFTTENRIDNVENKFVSMADSPRFSEKALIKLISYDVIGTVSQANTMITIEQANGLQEKHLPTFRQVMDGYCGSIMYDANLVTPGPSSADQAKAFHATATITSSTTDQTVDQYMSFSGENQNTGTTTIIKAGVTAVCWCGYLNYGTAPWTCQGNWRFASLLMVAGPMGGETWQLPTEMVSRIELKGSGFRDGDILRFIPNSGSCTGGSSPTTDTNYKTGCPSIEGKGCITGTAAGTDHCPNIDGSTCQAASMAANSGQGTWLKLQTVTQRHIAPDGTVIGIHSIVTTGTFASDQERTIIRFSDKINTGGILEDGDTIVIKKADILVDGDAIGVWKTNSRKREAVDVLTNVFGLMDASDPETGVVNELGWKIKFFDHPDIPEADKGKYVTIPLRWTGEFGVAGQRYPYSFAFSLNTGSWSRSNRISTNPEIKGTAETAANAPLKVCWGREETGNAKYYIEAGTLRFVKPPPMTMALLSFTTSDKTAPAPVIIHFQTGASRSEYASYSVGKSHKLVVRVKETTDFQIYQNGDLREDAPALSQLLGSDQVAEYQYSQNACGKIFIELWSNDHEGFPLPKGCYYSREIQDADAPGTTYREIVMIFYESNGIKHVCKDAQGSSINCEYQMVLYAKGADITGNNNYVTLYTRCDGCLANGGDVVFEIGETVAQSGAPSPGGTQDAPGPNDPNIDIFNIITINDYINLGSQGTINIQMKAPSSSRKITAGCHITIYMLPLLQWALPTSSVTVHCIDYVAGDIINKCGGPSETSPELTNVASAVVSQTPTRRNKIKITLPTNMQNPITNEVLHQLRVSGLTLPDTGFFNKKWGVEVTKPDNTRPAFKWMKGYLLREPIPGMTTGRIVILGDTGYGPKPFKGQTDNIVYVRLQLGATLYSTGYGGDKSTLSIMLPSQSGKDYDCSVVGEGRVPVDASPFQDFDLNVYHDNNYAALSVNPLDGQWANAGSSCDYHLQPNQAIHAGQVFYVKLTVDNPDNAMTRNDPGNVWKLKLSSFGVGADSSIDMPSSNGYAFGFDAIVNSPNKLWYKNLGVLDEVSEAVLQPMNLIASTANSQRKSWFYVFFMPATDIGRQGIFKLDGPCGFDFMSTCAVKSLPAFYYDYTDIGNSLTQNITSFTSCQGQTLPVCGVGTNQYNRANVKVGDNIRKGKKYGFQIEVIHAIGFNQFTQNTWKLYLADNLDYVIDGTQDTLNFLRPTLGAQSPLLSANGNVDPVDQADKAFGMYASDFQNMNINIDIPSLIPTSMAGTFGIDISFDGFIFQQQYSTNFRVTAPAGFNWNGQYSGRFETISGRKDWACGNLPMITEAVPNQMRFDTCNFNPDIMYGFKMEGVIPDVSDSSAGYFFIIEMGYLGTDVSGTGPTSRLMGTLIDAPLVSALRNCVIDYFSNRVSNDNRLTVTFRLITPLNMQDDGIVIEGQGLNSQFFFTCYSEVYKFHGYNEFPSDYGCQFANQRYTLYRKETDFPAGYYKFHVTVTNPANPIAEPASWLFGSYKASWTGGYPNSPIDKSVLTMGFPVRISMPNAKLVTFSSESKERTVRQATGRNDRPGYLPSNPQVNQLIFEFTLTNRPTETAILMLRGPDGFSIQDDCTSKVITSDNLVFGPNTAGSWDSKYTKWPQAYAPTKCDANGPRANITIPVGLDAGSVYVFRLEIASNPSTTPDPNLWTIEYNGESSLPFEGFILQTVTGVSLTPVSSARRSSDPTESFPNQLEFGFQPSQTIRARDPALGEQYGGMIRLKAPPGYEFTPSDEVQQSRRRERVRRSLKDQNDNQYDTDAEDLLDGAEGVEKQDFVDHFHMNLTPSESEFKNQQQNTESIQIVEKIIDGDHNIDSTLLEKTLLEKSADKRKLVTKSCLMDLRSKDGQVRFVTNDDIVCEISGNTNNGMNLSGKIKSTTKSVSTSKEWLMTVYVYNRPTTSYQDNGGFFTLETFDKSDGAADSVLDLAQIPGFKTLPLMNLWTVTNTENQNNGMQSVRNIMFVISLPDELRNNDELWILAPEGFDLKAQGASSQCNNFLWDGCTNDNPCPSTHPFGAIIRPACECRPRWLVNGVNRCGISFVMNNLPASYVTNSAPLRFTVDTQNPSQVNSEIGNYWVASHLGNDGTELGANNIPQTKYITYSTSASRSWDIKPQLQGVTVTIVGSYMAAESFTDIMVNFLPVQKASFVKIQAMQPPEFKFDAAIVDDYQVDDATGNNVIVLNNVNIVAGVTQMIRIKNVKLGLQGGQSIWTLGTYDRALVGAQPQDASDVRDEAVNINGFIMPGRLTLVAGKMELESDYQLNAAVYPTESQFPARASEQNTAQMVITVSQTVYSKSILKIACEGLQAYEMEAVGVSVTGTGAIETDVVRDTLGALVITLKPNADSSSLALAPGSEYSIRFRTTPKIGQSAWRITTFPSLAAANDPTAYPINTNDGVSTQFAPVTRIGFIINVLNDRRPPNAIIDVNVEITPGPDPVKQVIVIGPPGFDFPQACGNMCMPYSNVGVQNRRSVKLESPQGVELTPTILKNLMIKSITPSVTPSERSWFAQTRSGYSNGGWRINGWEKSAGFSIKQMSGTKLIYPSRRGLRGTYFAFVFNLSSDNGKIIEINPPVLYELYCSTMPLTGRPALQQISLPGNKPQCVDSPLTLTLDTPLYAGTYSFIVGGNVPAQGMPAGTKQYFSLIIKNAGGQVLDAAYELPAISPLQEIMASNAVLSWVGAPVKQQSTVVRVSITFDQPTVGIQGLLVTFPKGLKHDIQVTTDVKNLNKAFPVAPASSWVDHGNDAYIKLLTDESQSLIPEGTYSFEFPILNPLIPDPENIWYFSLCSNRQCYDIETQGLSIIPMTFPMPGFKDGEISPDAIRDTSGSMGRYYGFRSFMTMIIFAIGIGSLGTNLNYIS